MHIQPENMSNDYRRTTKSCFCWHWCLNRHISGEHWGCCWALSWGFWAGQFVQLQSGDELCRSIMNNSSEANKQEQGVMYACSFFSWHLRSEHFFVKISFSIILLKAATSPFKVEQMTSRQPTGWFIILLCFLPPVALNNDFFFFQSQSVFWLNHSFLCITSKEVTIFQDLSSFYL